MGLYKQVDTVGECGIAGGDKFQIRCDRPQCDNVTRWVSSVARAVDSWWKHYGFEQTAADRHICGKCVAIRDENMRRTGAELSSTAMTAQANFKETQAQKGDTFGRKLP